MFPKFLACVGLILTVTPSALGFGSYGTTGNWTGDGSDDEWTTSANWEVSPGDDFPISPGDTTNVRFGGGVDPIQNVNVSADVEAESLEFESNLRNGVFRITGSGNTISLSGYVLSNHQNRVFIDPNLKIVDEYLEIRSNEAGRLQVEGSIFGQDGGGTDLMVNASDATSSIRLNGVLDSSLFGVEFAGPGVKLVASGLNNYGGPTTVSDGTLRVSGNLPSGSDVSIYVNSRLRFSGGVFGWSLFAPPSNPSSGVNQGTYNTISVAGRLSGSGVFDILLAGNVYGDAFWDTSKTWDIASGSGTYDLSSTFTQFSGAGVSSSGLVTNQGQFSLSGTSLNWSPVPEPSNALVGILLGAGLVFRRGRSKCR